MIVNRSRYPLAAGLILVAFLWGCSPKASEPKPAETKTTSTAPTPEAEKPKPVLPETLKSEAYRYYGLSNEKPLDMEVISRAQPGSTTTGAQLNTLSAVEGSVATYQISRTGNLQAQLGNMEVTLESDGIYVKSSDIAQVGKHDLEFPNTVTPGFKWSSRTQVTQPNREIDLTVDSKIVGVVKLKAKSGDVDALLVTSGGKGKVLGQPTRMESKSWFVKDVGMVRSEMKTSGEKGKSQTVTIRATGY
jgi:hypothetical protein